MEFNSKLKTEKEMLLKKNHDDKISFTNKFDSLQLKISEKDKELMSIKANEYDKVDVIKQLAEVEGKQTFLANDNDRLKDRLR